MTISEHTFQTFLDQLGERTPAPGGGAAAGAGGAIGAAIAAMAAAFSDRKPALDGQSELAEAVAGQLREHARLLTRLGGEDAEAFSDLGRLMAVPKGDPQREAGWADAVEAALTPPRATLAACCEVLRTLDEFLPRCNPRLISDLAVGAVFASAGARAAWWNVKVNLPLVRDEARRAELASEADVLSARAKALAARVEAGCAAPGSIAIDRAPLEQA